MIRGQAAAVAALCCLFMGSCASGRRVDTPQTYTVRPQDTLYSIAWRHEVDFRDLAKWNNIGGDYRLAVGQVLVLHPNARSAPATVTLPAPPPHASSAAPPHARSGVSPPHAPSGAPPHARSGAPMKETAGGGSIWSWPTERVTAPRPVPGGGILLLGEPGQDVRAASNGRVVYTGSGLRGFGNLIIIKHGESLLSSYAHNRELLVREGQEVLRGQVIAHMGVGPHQVCALYFEIRINGKPVDPLRYLGAAPSR